MKKENNLLISLLPLAATLLPITTVSADTEAINPPEQNNTHELSQEIPNTVVQSETTTSEEEVIIDSSGAIEVEEASFKDLDNSIEPPETLTNPPVTCTETTSDTDIYKNKDDSFLEETLPSGQELQPIQPESTELTNYSLTSSHVDGYYTNSLNISQQRDSNHEGWVSRSIYYLKTNDNRSVSTANYLGQEVKITQKGKINGQDHAYIKLSNGDEGWVPQNAILQKSNQPYDVNLYAWISRSIGTIDSLPYGMDGARRVGYTGDCLGDYVNVYEAMDTARGLYYKIENPHKKHLSGWVSKDFLLLNNKCQTQDTNMTGWISRSIETINTKPYATQGSVLKGYTSDNLGKEINIYQSATTARGLYYYVQSPDKKVNGWIHSRAVLANENYPIENISKQAWISSSFGTIDTKPYATKEASLISKTANYLGEYVDISQCATTARGRYYYIDSPKIKGWVHQDYLLIDTNPKAGSVDKVIETAEKYLGAVQGNHRHRDVIDKYNSARPRASYKMTYSDHWCDAFVSSVFYEAGASDAVGVECSVERHKNIFKNKGIWEGMTRPQRGDIVTFNWSGNRYGMGDHIGIVVAVNDDTITTIEGNTLIGNNKWGVGKRTYQWNNPYIQGYARPKYQ